MDTDHSRRSLLQAGAGLVVASAFPTTSAGARAARRAIARTGEFPSGVAAGHPGPRGISLWTRLGGHEQTRHLRLEVASDPDFRRVVVQRDVPAGPWRDFTVEERVQSKRLLPGERYFYRFATGTTSSPVGRFKVPLPADSDEPVRVAWFSCQRFEHGYFTPQAAIAAEDDLDLVLSLGDYLYEETGSSPIPDRDRTKAIGEPHNNVETLAQWRALWQLYRTDAGLQAMHAAHPYLAVWDDCEVEGNWAGNGPSSGPTPVDGRSVEFAVKQRNAFKAFFENMPMRSPRAEPRRIYRSLRLGGAEVFMLDTRQYRDPQPCGDAQMEPCPEAESPRKRLGDDQLRWLQAGLERSQASWKLLGNPQMLMAIDLPPGQPVGYDSWDGYAHERRLLTEHIRAQSVQDVVSLVGDVHCFFAGEVTTTGRTGGQPAAAEFVGTSVTHSELNLPGLPKDVSNQVTNQVILSNPHLTYAEFRHRGYAVATVSRDELLVDFKGVRTVTEPASDSFTVARFRLGRGETRPQRVG